MLEDSSISGVSKNENQFMPKAALSHDGEQSLPPGGRLRYWSGSLEPGQADGWLSELRGKLDWAQRSITLFGRLVLQPRLVAFHGDCGLCYRYSGSTLRAQGWSGPLEQIRDHLDKLLDRRFNSVLCNWYRDGNDCMGWHADNEPELGPCPLIASVSFGQSRRFLLKPRQGDQRIELMLEHGSILVMDGDLQRHWLHQLPRMRKVDADRINLTFRTILPRRACAR
jgi:alkylated DNA repair dioxygenase AlkB